MMLSDVCLSVAYIGPKSRIERPRKTKIGTEVAHVARNSDTTFTVKRSKVKVTGAGHTVWRPPTQLVLYYITLGLYYITLGLHLFIYLFIYYAQGSMKQRTTNTVK